jgi:uncharacterized caspase-like protein
MKSVLERNSDGTVNFAVRLLTGTGPAEQVPRSALRDSIEDLFAGDDDIALLYVAGHGFIDAAGGYLCASDTRAGHDGLSLADIIAFANQSRCRNKIIMLDSCHAGIAGNNPGVGPHAALAEGLTILTASTAEQYASEENGSGIFTTLLVDALNGAGGNLVGDVTPGSIYSHIDQSLGPWEQRPVFKTNVKSFVSLRKVQPPIGLGELQQLPRFFPTPGYELPLDPTYEPESAAPDPVHTAIFATLQRYNRVNLVVPVDAPHMYHAAMQSKSCKLTVLGEHYRRLVEKGRI